MDTFNEVWAIALLAAVPIAGFVGFIVHALTVRKSSLEIQKLRYEIEKLKSEQGRRESLIEIANFDQVMRFSAEDRTKELGRKGLAYAPRRGLYFALVLLVVAIVIFVVVYLFLHGATK
jgi:hypothetical protein